MQYLFVSHSLTRQFGDTAMHPSIYSPSFPLFHQVADNVETLLPEGFRPTEARSEVSCPTWEGFHAPLMDLLPHITPLKSGSNHPLEFTFPDQVYTLTYFHVEEYTSGRGLIEDLCDPKQPPLDGLPQSGIPRSTFFDAIHTRGLPRMLEVLDRLGRKARRVVGISHEDLGDLQACDGSLVDATLSMEWADYTSTTNKAKVHLDFDLNYSIPRKIRLTDGKGAERPQVDQLLEKGQTGVMDRNYEEHRQFDIWKEEGKFFVCRIRKNIIKTILRRLPIPEKSNIFFHAEVYLGDDPHRTRYPVRLIGFKVGRKTFWIATNRTDLTALQIAFIYRLRWEIEKFFCWWKRHLNVYHLIARSPHGLMMQLLGGLITYLLLMIYFYRRFREPPSLSRLRELRRDIRKERALRSEMVSLLKNRRMILLLIMSRYGPWENQTVILAIF